MVSRFLAPLVLICAAFAVSAQSWCANGPLNPAEQTICLTPDLGWRDQQLEDAYAATRHMPGVQTAQQAWLAGRNACGWNAWCIRNAYDDRLAELQLLVSGAGGKPQSPATGLHPVGGPGWCTEGSLNAAERTICAHDDLGQMDLYMADLYAQVRHYPGVQPDQVSWLAARNACQADYPCLYQAYAGRITELRMRYGVN